MHGSGGPNRARPRSARLPAPTGRRSCGSDASRDLFLAVGYGIGSAIGAAKVLAFTGGFLGLFMGLWLVYTRFKDI